MAARRILSLEMKRNETKRKYRDFIQIQKSSILSTLDKKGKKEKKNPDSQWYQP